MARDKLKIKLNKCRYYLENREKILKQRKDFAQLNKEKIQDYQQKYRQENKKILSKKKHDRYLKTRNHVIKKVSEYYKINKELCNDRRKKRNIVRRQKDINFKIKWNLRSRLSHILNNKSKRTLELLGCSIEFLKQHLEKQFTEGMNWNNYGKAGWVIDHIKPCSLFDLSKPSEQRKCFSYKNLQPLWEVDNLIKSDKY